MYEESNNADSWYCKKDVICRPKRWGATCKVTPPLCCVRLKCLPSYLSMYLTISRRLLRGYNLQRIPRLISRPYHNISFRRQNQHFFIRNTWMVRLVWFNQGQINYFKKESITKDALINSMKKCRMLWIHLTLLYDDINQPAL